MRALIALLILVCHVTLLLSQTYIKGKVVDDNGNNVSGANVYIKGSYDGTSTDSSGQFIFKTLKKGTNILIVSFVGYKEFSRSYDLDGKDIIVEVIISEIPNEMNSVVVQAGTFGAADSKKAVRLSSYDILTTASAVGDVYGALHSFPGTSVVGEDGGLFVRGGEGYETKTFMDGMLVHKPFTSKMPDLPSRGRFMPLLFSGTTFSTGGYSAEYGQAMSSALILTSNGMPDEPITSVSILPFGGGISKTFKGQNTSFAISGNFYNLTPYNAIIKQDVDWDHSPQSTDVGYIFRHQTSHGTMIKSYLNVSRAKSSLWMQNFNFLNKKDHISLTNDDIYSNTTCIGKMNERWDYKTGIAYTYDDEIITLNNDLVEGKERNYQIKSVLNRKINDKLKFRAGAEIWIKEYYFAYSSPKKFGQYNTSFTNLLPASFIESDYLFSKKLSTRLGIRTEYSSLGEKVNLAPRISLAFQTGSFSQISVASGIFYQGPENEYLRFNKKLGNEKAVHYIMNYQYVKESVTFRVEGYYKDYANLVKFDSINSPSANAYNNKGYGYARGFDIFYRVNKGLDKNDFWLSYSFLDTKRKYHDFPFLAVPSHFPKHTFSVSHKRLIAKTNTLIGFTYIFASGRTYTDPNYKGFMNSWTGTYNDLSFSANYLWHLWNNLTVIHFSVSNVFGFENTYGYHFSSNIGEDGKFKAYPIKPGAKRFILLGIFFSI